MSYAQEYPGTVTQPTENVAKGLAFGTIGVLIGVALTVGIWKLGFIASITAMVLSAAAVFLYQKGSGGPLVKGRIPLVLLIIVGVIIAFFACIAVDASAYYTDNAPPDSAISRFEFIRIMITDPEVIGSYGRDFLMFVLFAGLGAFGTIRALVSKPQPEAAVVPGATLVDDNVTYAPDAEAPHVTEAQAPYAPYAPDAPLVQPEAPLAQPQAPLPQPEVPMAPPAQPDESQPPAADTQ